MDRRGILFSFATFRFVLLTLAAFCVLGISLAGLNIAVYLPCHGLECHVNGWVIPGISFPSEPIRKRCTHQRPKLRV